MNKTFKLTLLSTSLLATNIALAMDSDNADNDYHTGPETAYSPSPGAYRPFDPTPEEAAAATAAAAAAAAAAAEAPTPAPPARPDIPSTVEYVNKRHDDKYVASTTPQKRAVDRGNTKKVRAERREAEAEYVIRLEEYEQMIVERKKNAAGNSENVKKMERLLEQAKRNKNKIEALRKERAKITAAYKALIQEREIEEAKAASAQKIIADLEGKIAVLKKRTEEQSTTTDEDKKTLAGLKEDLEDALEDCKDYKENEGTITNKLAKKSEALAKAHIKIGDLEAQEDATSVFMRGFAEQAVPETPAQAVPEAPAQPAPASATAPASETAPELSEESFGPDAAAADADA